MKSTKTIVIGLITIVVLYLFIRYALGIYPTALFWALFYPLLIAAIHIVSAQSLFRETKLREEEKREIFMGLDPLFWVMVGLAFGILGLIAFRLINDHFTIEKQN